MFGARRAAEEVEVSASRFQGRRRLVAVPLSGAVVLAVALVLLAPLAARAQAPDGLTVPPGYRLEARSEVARGVEHLTVVRDQPPVVVNVARLLPGASATLRSVLSNERLAGPEPRFERTSEMCRRVRCILGVNADFASLTTGQPIGGMVVRGQIVRSPTPLHHQLTIAADGSLRAGSWTVTGRVMSSDLREIGLTGVNIARGPEAAVLYTPPWGRSTGTNPHGTELVLRHVQQPQEVRLDHTSLLEVVGLHANGDTPIPRDGLVLSGHGAQASAIRDLWHRIEQRRAGNRVLLRVEGETSAVESVGGTPVLVHEGRRWVAADGNDFVVGRHPRTLVGWNPGGATLLVTVDGRQPEHSVGMSLLEAADLLLALGATEGINLDGGGSTTFVSAGRVVNTPSDRLVRARRGPTVVHVPRAGDDVVGVVERPTVSALMVVPSVEMDGGPSRGAGADALGADPALPQAHSLALDFGAEGDAGSDLEAGRPALVALTPTTSVPLGVVSLALLGDLAVAVAWVRTRRLAGVRR